MSRSENATEAFNASVNILAVEYLVKTNNKDEYGRKINILYKLSEVDLEVLHIDLSLNMHIRNLGEMITQGDYEHQKERLFAFLEAYSQGNLIIGVDLEV